MKGRLYVWGVKVLCVVMTTTYAIKGAKLYKKESEEEIVQGFEGKKYYPLFYYTKACENRGWDVSYEQELGYSSVILVDMDTPCCELNDFIFNQIKKEAHIDRGVIDVVCLVKVRQESRKACIVDICTFHDTWQEKVDGLKYDPSFVLDERAVWGDEYFLDLLYCWLRQDIEFPSTVSHDLCVAWMKDMKVLTWEMYETRVANPYYSLGFLSSYGIEDEKKSNMQVNSILGEVKICPKAFFGTTCGKVSSTFFLFWVAIFFFMEPEE